MERGAGLVLKGPDDQLFKHALRFRFMATNNEAEYEALLSGLRLALELRVRNVEVFTDLQLVVGHVNGSHKARDATMAKYLAEERWLVNRFKHFAITRVP